MKATESAVNYIKSLNSGNTIRVKVVGGGCSGMSYTLDFDNSDPLPDNHKVIEIGEGVRLVIDPKSSLVLGEAVLDYTGGLNGQGLFINSPSFSRVCGCGSSFSI